MKYDVFVSYSRKDSEIVQSVVDRLKAEGYRCWMDVNGIESGDAFKRVLVQAIKDSKIVLFFSSCNSNSTEWTVKEINIAVQLRKPIIPVLLDDTSYDDSILFDLSGLDYIPYQKKSFRNEGLEKLLRGVAAKCDDVAPFQSQNKSLHKPVSDGNIKVSNFKWRHLVVLILIVGVVGVMLKVITKGEIASGDVPVKGKMQSVQQKQEGDDGFQPDNRSAIDKANRIHLIIQRVDPFDKYGFGSWPIDWDVDDLEMRLRKLKIELDRLESIEKEIKTLYDSEEQAIGRASLKYA